jgi:hypothetical protein
MKHAVKKYYVRKEALECVTGARVVEGVEVAGRWRGFWEKVKWPDYKGRVEDSAGTASPSGPGSN